MTTRKVQAFRRSKFKRVHKVATVNLKAKTSLPKTRADLHKVLTYNGPKPDFVGLNEIGGPVRWWVCKRELKSHGLMGRSLAMLPDPVAFRRSKFKRIKRIKHKLTPRTYVGPAGAGPRWLRAKHIMGGVYQDKQNGNMVAHLHVHLAPSINLNEVRRELHRKQVQGIADYIRVLKRRYPGITIILTGDFNTSDMEKLQPIRDTGVEFGPRLGTWKGKAIDHIASNSAKGRYYTVCGLNTDHCGLVASIQVP